MFGGTKSSVLLVFSCIANHVLCDPTTCVSSGHREEHSLYYLCYCGSFDDVRVDVGGDRSGGGEEDDYFSLASFAYSLSGALFAKSIFITFQACRRLRVLMDQRELARIGSPYFRPDIQVTMTVVIVCCCWRRGRGDDTRSFIAEKASNLTKSCLLVSGPWLRRRARVPPGAPSPPTLHERKPPPP